MESSLVQILYLIALCASLGNITACYTSQARSSYGEVCNKTLNCDPRAWLDCYNGHCDCFPQDEMAYDQNMKRCVLKSGQRCKSLDGLAERSSIFEAANCVSNAKCGPEGICVCGEKFFEDSNGTCSPVLGHMESCSMHGECSTYQGLQCEDGLCQCNKSTSVYSDRTAEFQNQSPYMLPLIYRNHPWLLPKSIEKSEEEIILQYSEETVTTETKENTDYNQCVGLAGFPCIISKCTKDARCLQNTCICDGTFYAAADGKCMPKIKRGSNCTASSQCEQNPGQTLVCVKGMCDCDPTVSVFSTAKASIKMSETRDYSRRLPYNMFPFHSGATNPMFHGFVLTHNSATSQCVGLPSSPCIDRLCAPNAFCSYPVNEYDLLGQTCKCQPGFTESKSHVCAAGYESVCSASSACIDGLVCRNSRCLCPYKTQKFDDPSQTCLSQVGGPCSGNSFCQGTAECVVSNNGTGAGHCACKRGYVENMVGKCEAGFGTDCRLAGDCDTVASLECIDNKCGCPVFAEYSSALRKCVGLVGAKCIVNKRDESQCTKNSRCQKNDHDFLPGSCACKPGFKETKLYTCNESVNEL